MNPGKYTVMRTEKVREQLLNIAIYIADTSGDVDTALRYMEKLEKEMDGLCEFPNRGAKPRDRSLRLKGLRALIVNRHLIFYTSNDETRIVTIEAVVDSRRRYLDLV